MFHGEKLSENKLTSPCLVGHFNFVTQKSCSAFVYLLICKLKEVELFEPSIALLSKWLSRAL